MKKLLTAALSVALIAALSATAMAVSEGDIVKRDDDYYDDVLSFITPGEDCYLIVVDASDYNANKKPTNAKWDDLQVNGENFGTSKKYLSVSSSATKLKIGSGTNNYAWGFKLDPKTIKAADYDESLDVDGVIVYKLDGSEDTIHLSTTIEYEEGNNEFTEDIQSFPFERNDDVDIDFPDGNGRLTGTANKKFTLLASMTTTYNSTLSNKYPNANLEFYNGNGVSLSYIKSPKLYFEAETGHFLYEINSDNTLTDLSNTYSSKDKAFVVNARDLGKYVVSDRALSASGNGGNNNSGNGNNSNNSNNSSNTNKPSNTGNASLDSMTNLLLNNFSNKFVLLSNGVTYGVTPKSQTYAVATDLTGMNTADMVLYTYDEVNNRLIGSANKPKVGTDGKLYITTNTTGYYVVSSGALTPK